MLKKNSLFNSHPRKRNSNDATTHENRVPNLSARMRGARQATCLGQFANVNGPEGNVEDDFSPEVTIPQEQ